MQGCHSRVARRLVGVGLQMASIRSPSIGPFGSFTTSGEGLKLPVSEFHPILRQYSRCPLSRLSRTADSQRSNRGPPDIGACGPSESRSYRCSGDTEKIEWWPGAPSLTQAQSRHTQAEFVTFLAQVLGLR